jgi:hypothetical protein
MPEDLDSNFPPASQKPEPKKTAKTEKVTEVPEQSLTDRLLQLAGDSFILLRVNDGKPGGFCAAFVPGNGAYKIGYDGFVSAVQKNYQVVDITAEEWESL